MSYSLNLKFSKNILILLLALASSFVTSGSYAQDPGTIYLEAYLQVEDAEKLEKESKFNEALRKYTDAKNILDNIAREHRGWRPEVLDYRRRKVNEAIDRCKKILPKDAVPEKNIPASNNQPGNDGNLLEQREETIKNLESAQKQLRENLQKTQLDYNKALDDLKNSKDAQVSLTNELTSAQEKLKSGQPGSEGAETLKAEIALLQKDLVLVNESFANAKKKEH
ncbi:MAG: hypothetical protein ACJ0IB_06485 [Verrucomicrobiales bacterium]